MALNSTVGIKSKHSTGMLKPIQNTGPDTKLEVDVKLAVFCIIAVISTIWAPKTVLSFLATQYCT